MDKNSYVRPEIKTMNILSGCIICQSYGASDVSFGPNGGAGATIGNEDINYGGSF